MVAEKPSLALSIAKILSNNKFETRKGRSQQVHEYSSEGHHYLVTSVCGHVFSVDFNPKYNDWNKTDPNELFTAPIIHQEANPKLHIPAHLANEAKKCNKLVLWLDCDKEGENICFEVMKSVEKANPNIIKDSNLFRAYFSALTDNEIKKAMRNLGKPDKLVSLSVDARQELDLRIGCAFTRFQTRYFQGKYADLDSSCISYGPCQTPTLSFCVARHDLIQSFIPEAYQTMNLVLKGYRFKAGSSRGRIFDKTIIKTIFDKISHHKLALVSSVKSKEKSKPRPIALNTVNLLKVCSSGLGIGPHQAMQIAERLYTGCLL